jgi:glutaredoxin-related protein
MGQCIVCKRTITNVAAMRNLEFISDNVNIQESVGELHVLLEIK